MAFTGIKYDGYRDIKDIAKDVRKDIKAVIKSGKVPQIKTGVRIERYSMGRSLNVTVKSVPTGFMILNWDRLAFQEVNPHDFTPIPILSDEGKALIETIRGIVNQYNYDNSDTMTDYFDRSFYETVEFSDDLEEAERARFHAAA